MSSTNRAAIRQPADAYLTPEHVARACVAALPTLDGLTVWEPHAGAGAFVYAAAERRAFAYGSDLGAYMPPLEEPEARRAAGWKVNHPAEDGYPFGGRPDWIIGNPPFAGAEDHIHAAIERATIGAAFLLRMAFLEGAARQQTFWRAHRAAEIHTFIRRPSFLEWYDDATIGPLRKREPDGSIAMNKDGTPKRAGTDSAAYAFFVWRRGHTGPTTHHFLDWP